MKRVERSFSVMFSVVTFCAVALAEGEAPAAVPAAEAAGEAAPEGEAMKWTDGPAHFELGEDIAQLEVPAGYAIVGGDDARALLRQMGNRPSGNELALLVPSDEKQTWFMIFSWMDTGYVKDDEKDEIDADALLESIQEGTEEANTWRKENGIPTLRVTGWAEAPRYDETTNNLVWATLAESEDGSKSSNYNMRYLGRRGIVSATLVESAEALQASKPLAMAALKDFSFKSGSKYSEWQKGDKVSEYGLTALVAAGAGAAALKLGLFGLLGKFLAKGGKLIIVAGAALLAGLSKLWSVISGRASARSSDE